MLAAGYELIELPPQDCSTSVCERVVWHRRQQVALASQTHKKEVEVCSKKLQKSRKQTRKIRKENTGWHEQIESSKAAEEDLLTERVRLYLSSNCMDPHQQQMHWS